MDKLPKEVLYLIVQNLHPKDCIQMASTCKMLNHLCLSDGVWAGYCRQDFGMKCQLPSKLCSCKQKYFNMRCYNIWLDSICNHKGGVHACIYSNQPDI